MRIFFFVDFTEVDFILMAQTRQWWIYKTFMFDERQLSAKIIYELHDECTSYSVCDQLFTNLSLIYILVEFEYFVYFFTLWVKNISINMNIQKINSTYLNSCGSKKNSSERTSSPHNWYAKSHKEKQNAIKRLEIHNRNIILLSQFAIRFQLSIRKSRYSSIKYSYINSFHAFVTQIWKWFLSRMKELYVPAKRKRKRKEIRWKHLMKFCLW